MSNFSVRKRTVGLTGALLVSLAVPFFGATQAFAATTSSLLYSVDGGATWSSNVVALAGQTVLVRAWYDDSDAVSYQNASITTRIPAGFTRVSGSTIVCLNPSTPPGSETSPNSSEQVCNNAGGQSGAINEGSVWSGGTLTISPTAGLFGQSTGATAGVLEMGKKRYLNLQQCVYATADGIPYTNVVNNNPNGAGAFDSPATGASNTAGSPTAACGPGSAFYTPQPSTTGNSHLQPVDLLGNRYLNLQQCVYATADGIPYTNVVNNNPNGAGAFDSPATGASNTAGSPTAACGPGSAFYTPQPSTTGNSHLQPVDLLDTSRGAGYVQFAMTAPLVCLASQSETLSGTGLATRSSTGTIICI